MKSKFPGAVSEIPVRDIDEAAAYYESNLGFTVDWGARNLDLQESQRETAGCFWQTRTIEGNTATLGQC